MCNDKRGSTMRELGQRSFDRSLCQRVKSRGRFIKYQHFGFFQKGSSQRQALALAC